MSGVLQDIRYALRAMRGSPGLTFVIVASLAVGIGANTAIFSVINALLIKPLPYPDPERLAVIWIRNPGINIPQDWPSPGQYIDIQNQQHSCEQCRIPRASRPSAAVGIARKHKNPERRTPRRGQLFPAWRAAAHGALPRRGDRPGRRWW